MTNVELCVIAADAEHIVVHFKLHDVRIRLFTAQVDLPFVIFYLAPKGGERFTVEFDITFLCGPMPVKVTRVRNFTAFAFAEFVQDGRACFTGQGFCIEADPFFSDGESSDLLAVRKVEMNFSSFNVRFAVNRFTNDRVWYIIISFEDGFNEIFRIYLTLSIKYIYHDFIIPQIYRKASSF